MRKTIIPNKLNYKPQAHARVAKKMKKIKNDCRLKYFAVKGLTLEGCRRTVTWRIQAKLTTRILYSIKVLVQ